MVWSLSRSYSCAILEVDDVNARGGISNVVSRRMVFTTRFDSH